MALWRRVVSETHRRSLWQVLGIYLIGSWVGFQVVLALVQGIGLPSWLPGLAAALFVIGLPIVMATAFVQEGLPGSAPASTTLDPALFPTAAGVSVQPASQTRPRGRLAGLLTWRRAVAAGVAAFAVLGIATAGWLGLRALGMGPMASLLAAAELEVNDRILIAEFEPRGVDSTLSAVVSDAFRIDFARSTLMRSVTPAEVQEVLRRMNRADVRRVDAELAHQIAVRDGISAYVTGEVAAAGSSYMVSARLIATESGEVLVALREGADDDDDLIDAVDRLSTTLRERTGESLRTIRRAEPLAKVTTSSLQALQYYTQGGHAALWEGNPGRAIELHQEAVRLDTAFAAAHRALAVHYFNRGNVNRSIESAERALRFSDRMTEIERASSAATLHLSRSEFSQAAAALERVIAIDPQNASALNNLGLVYDAMKDLARGEEYYRRSVEADTGRFFAYTNLGEHLVLSGRYAEAEQAYADAALRAPRSAWPVVALAQVPYSAGDIDEAEARLLRLIDNASSTRGIQERANDRLVHLHRIAGRYADAQRRTRAQMAAAPDSRDEARLTIDRVHEELFVYRRPDIAKRELTAMRKAMAGVEASGVFLDAAVACGWIGDAACAREYIGRSSNEGALQPWSGPRIRFAAAGLARAEGDLPRALRILRDTRAVNCHACTEPLVARLFEEMNQPDSAAAAYERYIATPYMDRIFTDFALAPMHERLGGYYESRGDNAAAARHYGRFIALWRDADPELQGRVVAAQQRLAELQPDR